MTDDEARSGSRKGRSVGSSVHTQSDHQAMQTLRTHQNCERNLCKVLMIAKMSPTDESVSYVSLAQHEFSARGLQQHSTQRILPIAN
mmetsp:Transcript_57638/g.122592  ORF Transcript_57638/g.122592 Transcript_57638/m.122592 type:complete len:87 (-) Transcript_57638:97-357(-)